MIREKKRTSKTEEKITSKAFLLPKKRRKAVVKWQQFSFNVMASAREGEVEEKNERYKVMPYVNIRKLNHICITLWR